MIFKYLENEIIFYILLGFMVCYLVCWFFIIILWFIIIRIYWDKLFYIIVGLGRYRIVGVIF